jgi:hypothetical protein
VVFGYYPDVNDYNGLGELSRGFEDVSEVVEPDDKGMKDEEYVELDIHSEEN